MERAKDKGKGATHGDDDLKMPNKNDKQIGTATPAPTDYDFPYKPELKKVLEKARNQHHWDPELLKMSADDFKQLPRKEKRQWVIAHFILRRRPSLFDDKFDRESDEEEAALFV